MRRQNFSLIAIALLCRVAMASEYHYKNILIGERASGLGEAYVAISDDPSGVFHNPAGIIFGMEDYLSLTANAYAITNLKFKDLYPGQDYTYKFQGLVPAFFGFTQEFGRHKIGFAVVSPNSDLVDQNDTVTREQSDTADEIRFIRKFSRQDTTYLMGPAFATELAENFSFGISLFGLLRRVNMIDNTTIQFQPVGTGKYAIHLANGTTSSVAFFPKMGFQYMPIPKLSLGLVISKPFMLTGSGRAQVIRTRLNDDGTPVDPQGTFDTDVELQQVTNLFFDIPTPLGVSLGAAYFFNRDFLMSAQIDYRDSQVNYRLYPIRATFNLSLGTEYYLKRWLALRFGLYTNESMTKRVTATATNQPPHVNMIGGSAGVSYYRSGTSLSLSTSYTYGKGQGQAFADSSLVQDVITSAFTIYISGSYQL